MEAVVKGCVPVLGCFVLKKGQMFLGWFLGENVDRLFMRVVAVLGLAMFRVLMFPRSKITTSGN